MAADLVESILHWKKKLDKNPNDEYILDVFNQLEKATVTLEVLEVTHIGKTIRKLSKRDDIIGEKAKIILNKWREIFTNEVSDKNQKFPMDNKKENINKESSIKHISPEKTVNSRKQISHNLECKHEDNLLSISSAEQSSKKCVNGSCELNKSKDSSRLFYDVKEINLNYIDYDPHVESSEGYNPECPEFFPSDKYVKTKKPVLHETYEPSSMKRPLPDEKQANENKNYCKKLKSGNNPNSSSNNIIESKKISDEKNKNNLSKEKNTDDYCSTMNKKTIKKLHYESIKNQESTSAENGIHCKEPSEIETSKSKKTKVKIHSFEEFNSSEVSFEDCLSFNDIVSIKKSLKTFPSTKKQPFNNSPSREIRVENSQKNIQNTVSPNKVRISKDSIKNVSIETISLKSNFRKSSVVSNVSSLSNKTASFTIPKPVTKLNVTDISSTLPKIQPNYKPLPRLPEFYPRKKKEVLSNEEAIKFTSSRREKTAVYSGRKSGSYYTGVPTLFEICTRILSENIDAIECVGDASFEMMQSILEKCSPSQLYNIENYNPKFIENTNELWKLHCRRDCKLLSPLEHETWRDLYWRAHDEREKRLKFVTANISASIAKTTPIRQVKLAYVDSHYVKPPRDIARKQAKHGTGAPVNHGIKPHSTSKPKQRSIIRTSGSTTTSSSSISRKPKIAPLMAKTLKSLKAFRRK